MVGRQLDRPHTVDLAAFFSKIEVSETGCWIWRAALNSSYYPSFYSASAHRIAYRWFVGPIPELYQVDHLCRTKICVNPAHLEAVTRIENMRRGIPFRPRTRSAGTLIANGVCRQGHPVTAASLATKEEGGRTFHYCRICHAARARATYRRSKGKALVC